MSDVETPSEPLPPDEEKGISVSTNLAKVLRIGGMVSSLLEEVRTAPLDDDVARHRLQAIYRISIDELQAVLPPELSLELDRLSLPFEGSEDATEPELRVAQAQLVGWLQGIIQGIQVAMVAHQLGELKLDRKSPPSLGKGEGQYL